VYDIEMLKSTCTGNGNSNDDIYQGFDDVYYINWPKLNDELQYRVVLSSVTCQLMQRKLANPPKIALLGSYYLNEVIAYSQYS
jgi:hypothetical protein